MIRNFVYLDSGKLRSLSSQLFEGVTEQVIYFDSTSSSNEENQKGPIASGKLLADIFSQERSTSELRFLEDHAYALFEKRLSDDGLLVHFEQQSTLKPIEESFVKVTAKLELNDLAASAEVLRGFNKLGESFWRVQNDPMSWAPNGPKVTADADARRKAGEAGLQMNQKVAEAAAYITDFGYKNLFEAHMQIQGGTFSAPLKRDFLREDETMIVHKYSRSTQMEFSLVGVITQQGSYDADPMPVPDVKDADTIKQAMRSLAKHLRTLENTYSGPMHNEVILDPIAIYSVL